MKKIFAFAAAACCALALSATTYNCHLKVVINGEVAEQDEVPVVVTEHADGTYDLSLKNFVLWMGDFPMPVGNINVTGVEGVDEYGYTTIKFADEILITEGDDPQFDTWAGPLLGNVPIDMTARFTDTAASANIDIDMQQMLGQVITVSIFGVAPAQSGLEGDVNHDGEVNLSDVNKVIDIILND
jgi:hypothetical protein